MKPLSLFFFVLLAMACERIFFIKTYSIESRCVIGPENTLLAGASVSPEIWQAGAVKGLIKGSKSSLSLSLSLSLSPLQSRIYLTVSHCSFARQTNHMLQLSMEQKTTQKSLTLFAFHGHKNGFKPVPSSSSELADLRLPTQEGKQISRESASTSERPEFCSKRQNFS